MDAGAVFAMIGILIGGLLLIAIFLAVVILVYNKLYAHFVSVGKKVLAPIIIIGSVFLIGFATRFSIFSIIGNEKGITPHNYESLVISAFSMIYSSISIFSFEGISDINISGHWMLLVTFFSVSIWQAISFVLIITFGISYSFSSNVKLRLYAGRPFFKPHFDGIYIATNASNESLTLMKSIEKHNDEKKDNNPKDKNKRYLYIFAGDELGKYDRNNEIHRKIRINGYYYIPIEKGKDTTSQNPLLVALHLCRKRNLTNFIVGKKIKIFALKNDKNDRGLESANSDTAFDDIERVLTPSFIRSFDFEMVKNRDGKVSTLGYYVLSNSCLNYEFYLNKLISIIKKYFDQYLKDYCSKDKSLLMDYLRNNKDSAKTIFMLNKQYENTKLSKIKICQKFIRDKWMNKHLYKNYIKNHDDLMMMVERAKNDRNTKYNIIDNLKDIFQMYVLNEANLATDDLITKKEMMVEEGGEYGSKEINYKAEPSHTHRLLIAGFGQTGQEALDNLFEDYSAVYEVNNSTYTTEIIDEDNNIKEQIVKKAKDYRAYRFEALIIDKDILKIIGPYINTHPSFLFKQIKDYKKDFKGEEGFVHKEELIEIYKGVEEFGSKGSFTDIDNRMPFPRIFYYEGNYNDPESEEVIKEFINRNKKEGEEALDIFHGAIDSTIIALGDDESNIEVANALIFRLRQVMANKDNLNEKDVNGNPIKVEVVPSTKTDYKTTFDICVNIRDKNSVMRLTWEKDFDSINNDQVRVIPFGNYESMYSYNYILEENAARRVNYLYDYMKEKDITYDMFHHVEEKERRKIINLLKNVDEKDIFKKYFVISSYRKNVNKHAAMFAKKYFRYKTRHPDTYDEDYLAYLEHIRWARFHMSNGGLFNLVVADNEKFSKTFRGVSQSSMTLEAMKDYSKDYYRIHNCLLPYNLRYSVGVGLRYRKNDYAMIRYNDFIIQRKKEND